MTHSALSKFAKLSLFLLFPFMVSCSAFSGDGYSSDPIVAAQERRIENLEADVERAKKEVEAAEEREQAAKSRLKAAQDELKVLQTDAAKRNG